MLRVVALSLLLASNTSWPRFLGPTRDGRTTDTAFVDGWRSSGLRECWRADVGEGYAGLAVTDAVFGMDKVARDEFIFARRLEDGAELWRVRTGAAPSNVYGGLGPRVSPTVADGLVFTVSAEGTLMALSPRTGTVSWSRDLRTDLGWRPPAEGTSSTPLVEDGVLYLVLGGGQGRAVGAFDSRTGKTLWTSGGDRASYSSATRLSLGGRDQILVLLGSELVSFEPSSGEPLWSYPWATYDWVNVATPIPVGGHRIFISSGYDQGAVVLDAASPEPKVVWRSRVMKNHFNNSVHHDGVLYGFDESILKAVDVDSGELLWRARGFGKGSVIVAGKYLVLLSDDGKLALASPSRDRLETLEELEVLDGRTWTPPSIADGRLYARSRDAIVCLEPSD